MNEEAKKEEEAPKIIDVDRDIEKPKSISEPSSTEKSTSLMGKMKDMEDRMNAITDTKKIKSKSKFFKFPAKVRSKTKNLKKLMLKNKIQVILLKQTGDAQPTLGELKDGMLIVGDQIHNGADDIIWKWDAKTPTAIVPEWDMQPITKRGLIKTTESLKTWIHPQNLIIRVMMSKEAMDKMKGVGSKNIIWIILGAIVIGYLLFSSGGV